MAEIKVSQSSYSKVQQLSRIHLLDAVRVYPENVNFDGRDDEEQIILFLRQHPIVLIPGIFRGLGIFFCVILIVWALNTAFASYAHLATISISTVIGGTGIAITSLLYEFFKWYFTVTLVTSSRIVDLDFDSILQSRWSTTVLRAVQDVSYTTPGFINTLFDMANLVILTASHKENFELYNMPKARDVQDIIMDLVENEKQNGSLSNEEL